MEEVKKIEGELFQSVLEFDGLEMVLLKEKAVWIDSLKILLIADLHLGKAAHFRKSGIPIPEPIHDQDWKRLSKLHSDLLPRHTYFLGDLFHSDWNEAWTDLKEWLMLFPETQFHLVKGNHDILPQAIYANSILTLHPKPIEVGPLLLSHEPVDHVLSDHLNICGHIHPGIRIKGKARQSVRVPCFHQSGNTFILPRFGNFTGLALINVKSQDRIWAIAGEKVIPVLSGTSIG